MYGHLAANQFPLYDSVISASDRLDDIVQSLPADVRRVSDESGQTSSGTVYVWRFLLMMMAYRSYIIHRSFFVKSLADSRYKRSRVACVQAAETIISLANKGLPAVYYRLWNTTLWLVAAGIVMGVDLVHAATEKRIYPDIAARQRRLLVLIDLLNNSADRTGIGARGANVIRHLCAMERDVLFGSSSKLQFSRDEILKIVQLSSPSQEKDVTPGSGGPGAMDYGWANRSRRDPNQTNNPLNKDDSKSMQFSTSTSGYTEMGIDMTESNFSIPPWDNEVTFGTWGPFPPVQNHVDALFADMLPNPPT